MALVRVRLNGVEKNVSEALAKRADLKVLDEPVRRPDGTLRPEEAAPKSSAGRKSAAKKAAQSAETAEEATE